MNCPKCNSTTRKQINDIDQCCAICGRFFPGEVKVELDLPPQHFKRQQAKRPPGQQGGRKKKGESVHPEILACRSYMKKHFEDIKEMLLKGWDFSMINNKLPKNRPACKDSRSLRKYYQEEYKRREVA